MTAPHAAPNGTAAPLPPGSTGLPLVGETLDFMKDPFGFVEQRIAKHGPVFRTSVLGRPTVVLAGPEAAARFVDERLIERAGSMPFNVREIFAGVSLPLLDGEAHRTRKRLVMHAFGRDALAAYLPAIQARVEATLAAWTTRPEVRGIDALKRLAIEIIATDFLSLDPGPASDELVELYRQLLAGATALPVPVPGTTYATALRARDRILERLRAEVRRHREHASDTADGLGRMLRARDGGVALGDEDAVLELHHVFLAGYIVFAILAAGILALERDPELRARLEAEVRAASPSGPIAPDALRRCEALARFVDETKRTTKVVPFVFGRAKTSFEVHGFRVPEGAQVIFGLSASNAWAESFRDPQRFDPDRFARGEGRDEEHVFVPQGAGTMERHKCAGKDYSSVVAQVFAIALLRRYRVELPPQDLAYRAGGIPPEPRDGLRLRLASR